jgi:hypothetical protein
MDSSPLNLGHQIATATMKLAQDQQRATGEAALQLLESAQLTAPAQAASSGSVGTQINIKV